jgi:3',5'-cyclic AMP phosphodiesterase CpdA
MAYRIAHSSDLHLIGDREVDGPFLEGFFEQLREHQVDHLIVTGDITDEGDGGAFALLDRARREAGYGPARSSVLPGNHDLSGWVSYRRRFGSCLDGTRSLNDGCIKLVALNSTQVSWVPYDAPGSLEVGLRALARRLGALALGGSTMVVALHHHVINICKDDLFERLGRLIGVWGPLEGCEEFRTLMRAYDVKLVLSGHLHVPHSREVAGVRYSIGGGRHGFWVYDFDGPTLTEYRWVELCDQCYGHGMVACDACDDEAEVECDTCDGSQEVECEVCGGAGDVECPDCDGDDDCDTCGGDGEVDCPECHGSGSVECPDCAGDGHVPCEECLGQGELPCRCAG